MNVSKIALMMLVGAAASSYAAEPHTRQLARIEDKLDPLGTEEEMALFIRHNEPATIDNILRKRHNVHNGQAHLNSEEQTRHALSWFADFQDALNKERPSDRNNAREQRKRLTKAKIATRLPVALGATTTLLARYGNAHRNPKMINLAYLSGGLTALTGCRAAIKWYNAWDSTIMRDAESYNQKLDAINQFTDATRTLVRLRHAQLDQTRSAAVLAQVELEARLAASKKLLAPRAAHDESDSEGDDDGRSAHNGQEEFLNNLRITQSDFLNTLAEKLGAANNQQALIDQLIAGQAEQNKLLAAGQVQQQQILAEHFAEQNELLRNFVRQTAKKRSPLSLDLGAGPATPTEVGSPFGSMILIPDDGGNADAPVAPAHSPKLGRNNSPVASPTPNATVSSSSSSSLPF